MHKQFSYDTFGTLGNIANLTFQFICMTCSITILLHPKIWKTCDSTQLGPRFSSDLCTCRKAIASSRFVPGLLV